MTRPVEPAVLRAAAFCAALTVITTLCIHLLPGLVTAQTFEDRLALRFDPIYMGRLWIVLVHCVLVVVSMYGARTLVPSRALGDLGYLAFVTFAFTEILRTSLVIFALNRTWRAGYEAASDDATRERLRTLIDGLLGFNNALFFIFLVAFQLGLLCYGWALRRQAGWAGKIGWLLLAWVALSLPGVIDEVTGTTALAGSFSWVGPYFQPLARAALAVWLWRESRDAA